MLDTVNRGRTGGWDRASPAELSGGPWLLPARLAVGPPPPSTTKSPRAEPPSPRAPLVPAAGGGTGGLRPRDRPGLQQPAPRVHPRAGTEHVHRVCTPLMASPQTSQDGEEAGTGSPVLLRQGCALLAPVPALSQHRVQEGRGRTLGIEAPRVAMNSLKRGRGCTTPGAHGDGRWVQHGLGAAARLALVRLSPRSPAPSSCSSQEGTAPGRGWLQGLCLLPRAQPWSRGMW